jgi:hypothetical protein
VPGAAPHSPLQVAPGLTLEPGQLYLPVRSQPPYGLFHEPLFVPHVELGKALRVGYYSEDSQRRRHHQPFDGMGYIKVAHQRCHGGEDEVVAIRIVEKLPRQPRQLRRLDVQLHAQAPVLLSGLAQARLVARTHVADKERLEQDPTELLYFLLICRVATAP